MSPDHWSKLTWDTVSAGGYDLLGPIGYLDRKRDRAYKQRVIVTPAIGVTISSLLHLVGLRPRVYYTLINFRGGGGQGSLGPSLNTPMLVDAFLSYFA